jgi:hypothetical protein
VVVGAGFGGGANGWAFEVGGLAASALGAASVVAAGGGLASYADGGRDADGQLTVDSLGDGTTYAVPWAKTRTLVAPLHHGG